MTRAELIETFDRDEIVLRGLSGIAKQHVSDAAVNAALNAAEAYSRKHMLRLLQTGDGNAEILARERMRYAIAAGMIVAAVSPLAPEGGYNAN